VTRLGKSWSITPTFLKSGHVSYLPVYDDGKDCSETSEYQIQTPGNYPAVILQLFSTLVTFHTYLPMKIEQCSETSVYKIQTPGNYPEESVQQITGYSCHVSMNGPFLSTDVRRILKYQA